MWKNTVVRQATYENITWYTHFECWLTNATDTQWEYVTLLFSSTAKKISRNHRNVACMRTLPVSFILLGTFAKWRKATVRFIILSVTVRMEQLGYHWKGYHEIWYGRIFRKSIENVQVSLKFNKNNEYFTWRPMYIYDSISLNSSYNEKIFRQNCGDNHNTYYFQHFFQKIIRFMR